MQDIHCYVFNLYFFYVKYIWIKVYQKAFETRGWRANGTTKSWKRNPKMYLELTKNLENTYATWQRSSPFLTVRVCKHTPLIQRFDISLRWDLVTDLCACAWGQVAWCMQRSLININKYSELLYQENMNFIKFSTEYTYWSKIICVPGKPTQLEFPHGIAWAHATHFHIITLRRECPPQVNVKSWSTALHT